MKGGPQVQLFPGSCQTNSYTILTRFSANLKEGLRDAPDQAQVSEAAKPSHAHKSRHKSRQKHKESLGSIEERRPGPSLNVPAKRKHAVYDDPSGLFKWDSKGDPDNLVYGTIYRYSVPNFFRYGQGHIMGLPEWMRMLRGSSKTGQAITTEDRRYVRDYINTFNQSHKVYAQDESHVKRLSRKRDRQERGPDNSTADEFISLSNSDKQKNFNDRSKSDYRSIFRDSESDSSELEKDDPYGPDGQPQRPTDAVAENTVRLSQEVERRPGNAKAWLDLVDHQDAIISSMSSVPSNDSASKRKAQSRETKLAVYQKALKNMHLFGDNDKTIFTKAYMQFITVTLPREQVAFMWPSFLDRNASDLSVWETYIDFQLTASVTQTFQASKKVFENAIKLVKIKIYEAFQVKDWDLKDMLEKSILYLYGRLLVFLVHAGYNELATSLIQASASLNFTSDPLTVEGIQRNWDEEVERFGEQRQEQAKSLDPLPEDPVLRLSVGSEDRSEISSWALAEENAIQQFLFAGQLSGEEPLTDPFRYTMSSDFVVFLHKFGKSANQHLAKILLQFCSVDGLRPSLLGAASSGVVTDPFNFRLEINKTVMQQESRKGILRNYVRRAGIDTCPFDILTWCEPSYIPSCLMQSRDKQSLCMNLVDCLSEYFGEQRPDLLCIKLILSTKLDGAKYHNLGRNLLKKHRSCIDLWITFCVLQYHYGTQLDSRKSFKSVLSMASGSLPKRAMVCARWSLTELLKGEMTFAQQVAATVSDESDPSAPFTAPRKLRSLTVLSERVAMYATSGQFEAAFDCALCQCIIAYGKDQIEDLMDVVRQISDIGASVLEQSDSSAERFFMSVSKIMRFHYTTSPLFRRKDVQTFLSLALDKYPANSDLVELLYESESRFRIDGKVRNYVTGTVIRKCPSELSAWVLALWTELADSMHTNKHTLQNLFAQACENHPGSVFLWEWRIMFLMEYFGMAEASAVFRESLENCMWSQRLIKMVFRYPSLTRAFTGYELQNFYNVLVEKQLRIHLDLNTDLLSAAGKDMMSRERQELGVDSSDNLDKTNYI